MERDSGARGSSDFPERWSAERLTETMPGSTRTWWLNTMIPELVRKGALRKTGKVWIGRRSVIETALLGGRA